MDSSIVSEARFKLLGKRLGINLRETIGACYLVWLDCYNRRSEKATSAEIDVVADIEGFAAAMVAEKLAHAVDNGAHIVIHGVKVRIKFLNKQKVRGKNGGKASAESRRNSRLGRGIANEPNASPNALPNGSGAAQAYTPAPALTPSPAPVPDQKTKDKDPGTADFLEGFDQFWKSYPRKVAKTVAARAWRSLRVNGETVDRILADVERRCTSPDWLKESGKYIPHPATYLNGRRWEDEGTVLQAAEEHPEIAARRAANHAEDD